MILFPFLTMSSSINNKVLKKGRDLKEEMSSEIEMVSKGYRKLVKIKVGLRLQETIRFLSNEFRQKTLHKRQSLMKEPIQSKKSTKIHL